MGKTTLYHPIPLSTIRGAAEYCGFKLAKIKQKWSDKEKKTARYDVEIVKMPGHLAITGTSNDIHYDLQHCFMDDIEVHWVHTTKKGLWCCQLQIEIKPEVESIPDPEPGIEPIHGTNGAAGGGGGGEVETDVTWLIEDDGTFCMHCGRVFDQSDVSTYENERGESLCETCFYAELGA